ncbi:MAG: Ig-like domain-containing protein, partial [Gemmatimonadaceae bacterium]
RPRSSLVGLAALLSVTACAATMANGTLEVASCDRPPAGTTAVLLTPNAITLNPGGSLALSAANQAGRPIPACALRWTSSDSSAISVEPSGLVRAQRAGRSAEISATAVAGVARGVAQIRVAPAGPQ